MSRGLTALILAGAVTGLWLWPGDPGPAPSEPAGPAATHSEAERNRSAAERPELAQRQASLGPRPESTWRATVSEEIETSAALYAGDAWSPGARDEVLTALARLRVAAVRLERAADDPDGPRAAQAARNHRRAALAADELSRRLFGMPLASFLARVEGAPIEEVPAG